MSEPVQASSTNISPETARAVKLEIVDIFSELLQRIWVRLEGIIGEVPTATIFRGAVWETARAYPYLDMIQVDYSGISLSSLQENLDQFERAQLRAGLLALVDNTVGLLTDMTGGILLGKVEPLVEEFKEHMNKR